MDKQIETTVEISQDLVDFRALLDIEVLSIGGGEAVGTLY